MRYVKTMCPRCIDLEPPSFVEGEQGDPHEEQIDVDVFKPIPIFTYTCPDCGFEWDVDHSDDDDGDRSTDEE